MAIHIHPLDIPPRYYKPIGQLVAGWNLTEACVSSIIWHIHKIRNPAVGRLFTHRTGSAEKLRMFKVTASKYVFDSPTKDTMLVLEREARALLGQRNTIVHGLWGRMPKEYKTWKVFFLKDTEDTYKLRRETLTFQNLTDLAKRVRKLNANLRKLRIRIGAPPP